MDPNYSTRSPDRDSASASDSATTSLDDADEGEPDNFEDHILADPKVTVPHAVQNGTIDWKKGC